MNNRKRVGVFACVSDLYKAVRKTFDGAKLHYSKYLDYINDNIGDIIMADAYLSVHNGSDNFINCLQHYGYEVHTVKRLKKYNWHVGMTVDILANLDKIDTVILGSSSLEFIPLLKELKGGIDPIHVVILSSRINIYLRRYVDECIEISRELLECD